MKESEIIEYIKKPYLIDKADINQLKKLIHEFPFFQTAHILLLKKLKNNKPEKLDDQLSKSSVFVSDRDLLFKFLNSSFNPPKEEIKEKKENNNGNQLEKVRKSSSEKTISENTKNQGQAPLKEKNLKRKINNTFEGMGENISETLSSQIEFSSLKEKDKLEYSSEIYFIEEERNGKNNIITIDAAPSKALNKNDILQIEEIKEQETQSNEEKNKEPDLIEIDDSEETQKKEQTKKEQQFDIAQYSLQDGVDITGNESDLIARFIKSNPKIEPKEIKGEIEDVSTESVKENNNLLSETLIKVYINQGLIDKAIEAYKKLSLKYPEKNAYFASQIKILKEKNKQ